MRTLNLTMTTEIHLSVNTRALIVLLLESNHYTDDAQWSLKIIVNYIVSLEFFYRVRAYTRQL